ncbi:hypothetical protein [Pandoraea apista]|uniref:hypothetical protein n=1 Tax=Pandoraea apista TaxID=93218 RepID=UPI000F62728B|nr:hypothetical protein [Pandoraea apista]RRJ34368.1 hypothetical protein EIB05_03745 [Pandoraea apista]RRJ81487.1 hypothetical protein EIL82_03780 [Pandoraea apista]RSD08228.1 hypothetical protein EIZ52_24745 [Pandoraea apista]RSD16636.1 hypothetical protein EJB12_05225 [Pandoraea apista]RSK87521.1 hypothetical protein EJE96_02035 [Pandoraea apista]
MNALDLWHECRRRSLRLSLNGDKVRYTGPEESIAAMLPAMRASRDALLECVSFVTGLPIEDGPFMPYMPQATLDQVRQWQADLDAAIVEFAELVDWSDELLERVLFQVERQPISTLLPDLHWFRSEVQAQSATTQIRYSITGEQP